MKKQILSLLLVVSGAVYGDVNTDLINAAKNGDLNGVKAAIKAGANVNYKAPSSMDEYERTALIYAIENNECAVVQYLVQNTCPSLIATDSNGRTPLYVLNKNPQLDTVCFNAFGLAKPTPPAPQQAPVTYGEEEPPATTTPANTQPQMTAADFKTLYTTWNQLADAWQKQDLAALQNTDNSIGTQDQQEGTWPNTTYLNALSNLIYNTAPVSPSVYGLVADRSQIGNLANAFIQAENAINYLTIPQTAGTNVTAAANAAWESAQKYWAAAFPEHSKGAQKDLMRVMQ